MYWQAWPYWPAVSCQYKESGSYKLKYQFHSNCAMASPKINQSNIWKVRKFLIIFSNIRIIANFLIIWMNNIRNENIEKNNNVIFSIAC